MEYAHLTQDERDSMVQARIYQLERQHWENEIVAIESPSTADLSEIRLLQAAIYERICTLSNLLGNKKVTLTK